MKRHKWLKAVAAVVMLSAVSVWAAWTQNPYTAAGESAGRWAQQYSNTIRILESVLVHPSHTDGFVDKGDPVLIGDEGLTGIALESASAATDYINVATCGIVFLSVTNASAMAIGDEVFINTTTAALTDAATSSIKFGNIMTAISSTGSAAVRAVMIVPAQTVSSFTSVAASANLYAGGDLWVVDDGFIQDDLTVSGDFVTTTAAVGGGTVLSGIWVTTGTIAAGASTCTITLGTAPVIASDYITYSVYPDTLGENYGGHGDTYLDLEGGTTAECKISSATYIDLAVSIVQMRK